MRADRSLIPGIGAAVSLVAAVACAFFIAGAIVAFHGWPRVIATETPTQIVVASNPAQVAPLVVGRRIGAAGAPSAGSRADGSRSTIAGRLAPPAASRPAPRGPSGAPGPSAILAPSPPVRPPRPVAQPGVGSNLASQLGTTASKTTNSLAKTVGNLGGGVAGALAPASPAVAQVVVSTTAGLGTTVSALGGAVAGLLQRVGAPAKPGQ